MSLIIGARIQLLSKRPCRISRFLVIGRRQEFEGTTNMIIT